MSILTNETKIKLNNYKEKILAAMPNDEEENTGTNENPIITAKYTDSQWVDELTKRYFTNLIKKGQAILHRDALLLDKVSLE